MIAENPNRPDWNDELWTLLDGVCEDRATDADTARLEARLLADPAARRAYLDYIELHGNLHWDTAVTGQDETAHWLAAELAEPSPSHPARRRRNILAACAAVCALSVAAVLVFRSGTNPDPNSIAGDPPTKTSPDEPTPDHRSNPERPTPQKIVLGHPSKTSNKATAPAVAQNSIRPRNAMPHRDRPDAMSSAAVVAMIDERIREGWNAGGYQPSPQADDAEWMRRTYLNIAGQIPAADRVEEFLADKRADKRQRLIDELLDSPEYVRHFATEWTNLMVGRSMDRDVNRDAVHRFMRHSFARNQPWNDTVAELIAAEGTPAENGAAGFLLSHLNNEAVPATAITARIFLGTQVQCTQCHDHPHNDETQDQFWQLNSFFKQTEIAQRTVTDPDTGNRRAIDALVSKKVGGPTFYENLKGVMATAYPVFAGVKVDEGSRVNRRRELAELITSGEDIQLARAMVNRTWAQFFGYGFTNPIDDMGPHNTPSHPLLLDRLAEEFVNGRYDVKQLVRWICLSNAYSLTSRATPDNEFDNPEAGETPLFTHAYVRSMSAEQLYDSLLVATRAHYAQGASWEEIGRKRQQWLQQFVVAFETEENDEATHFSGTVPQALLLMNSTLVQQAVSPKNGTLFHTVLNEPSGEAEKIRQLCLAALSRKPTAKEMAAARQVLKLRKNESRNKQRATVESLQDVFWAYLNSNEFILIH